MIFHGYFLHTQVFLSCNGKPGTSFYGLIISYYHTLPAAYIAYATNHASGGTTTMFFIHFITCKSTYLYEKAIGIA